jgi:uncharacterized protein (TIGR02246 family)
VQAVDKDKKLPKHGRSAQNSESSPPTAERQNSLNPSEPDFPRGSELGDLYEKLQEEMRRPKPSPDAMAAALEAMQRLAAETDVEDASADVANEIGNEPSGRLCGVCGYRNRGGNKFCSMCGQAVETAGEGNAGFSPEEGAMTSQRGALSRPQYQHDEREPEAGERHSSGGAETHHYHHHYHHHYFPGGHETGSVPRHTSDAGRDMEKMRGSAVLRGESMSRAETAVRRITQEWVLACNTKHLDDLLELYIADALVLRSNYPPVRGAAAVREFFFGALDAGLGEVEVDPIRVEVVGDMAYEAGRCKALVPGSSGKRREERGKYLWVFARQSNGEWKLASDCWSSDLTLTFGESDVPQAQSVKAGAPRKTS